MSNSNSILGQYKGLKITRRVREVSQRSVEQELRHQARIHAVYRPTTAPAKAGSRVQLDFEGFMDGQPIPDSKMENITAVLGEGTLMPDAERAVCGHSAGETFRFDFTYPADFRVPELSGKTAQFEITLHSVAEKTIPEPNEAFAKSLGYASLSDLKDAIRKKKAAIHEANADRLAGLTLLDMAGANCTAAISPIAVDNLAHRDMKMLESKLKRSKLTLEQHCKRNNTTPEALLDAMRRKAEGRMRSVLAAKAIAEEENITVTKAEVEEEYHSLSLEHGTPEEEIRRVLTPEAIAANIATRKVQQFLLANADVTTVVTSGSTADKE